MSAIEQEAQIKTIRRWWLVTFGECTEDDVDEYMVRYPEPDTKRYREMIACHEFMLSKAAPSTPTVEEIMAAFDGAVEASTEPGDDDETQDWIDIKDVGVEFRSRLTKLLQQKGQAPSSKGD